VRARDVTRPIEAQAASGSELPTKR
jgi:hypothetical protein